MLVKEVLKVLVCIKYFRDRTVPVDTAGRHAALQAGVPRGIAENACQICEFGCSAIPAEAPARL